MIVRVLIKDAQNIYKLPMTIQDVKVLVEEPIFASVTNVFI